MTISIRAARTGDGPILHAMIRELAVHHGSEKEFVARPEDYEIFLSNPHALNGALVAEWNGQAAGCATWLSVLPAFRRKGIATALLKAVARLAVERKAAAVSWLLMGWNTEARRLYEANGATVEDGNCFCKLSGAALERLAS
ncbi:MAG: GNAT family N-acetyltransferase [Alphaproteobacteria bacterium]|nr:GNAT family N-acetyltransferase [Alphaproteobacteria bacterium]